MITLIVISDGRRKYIEQTIPSALAMLQGPITKRIIYDDTGDALEREWLRTSFPTFTVTHSPLGRQGFSGAVGFMWNWLCEFDTNDFVFHLENDFTFNESVPLDRMIGVLDEHAEIVQMSLKRQPVNREEKAAGDFIALHPDDYTEVKENDDVWLEHRRFFTTNPSLYRKRLCLRGWPQEQYSEGKFSGRYFRDHPDHVSGIWGHKWDAPRVTHIGDERTGAGY